MKLLVMLAILFSFNGMAQVNYGYDKAGNRVSSRYEIYKFDSILTRSSVTSSVPVNIIDDKLITIYPNPTDNGIAINVKGRICVDDVTVTDLCGKEVMKFNAFKNTWLDLSPLNAGIYFIAITTEDKKAGVWKVIKH